MGDGLLWVDGREGEMLGLCPGARRARHLLNLITFTDVNVTRVYYVVGKL